MVRGSAARLRARWWWPQLRAVLWTVGAVGCACALVWMLDTGSPTTRVRPWLDALPWAVFGLAALAWASGAHRAWAARRTKASEVGASGRRRPPSRWARVLWVAVHGAVTVAGAAAVMMADPGWLFGNHYEDRFDFRDGRTAYLYRGGLFCGYEVFVAQPGRWVAERLDAAPKPRCAKEAKLALIKGELAIVDLAGRPLEGREPDLGEAMYWGPR